MCQFLKMRRIILAASYVIAFASGGAVASAQEKANALTWDCVVNHTGVDLKAYFIGGGPIIPVTIPDGGHFPFLALKPKPVTVIGFDAHSGDLVSVTQFQTLPQPWPPTACYPLERTKCEPVKKAERMKSETGKIPTAGVEP